MRSLALIGYGYWGQKAFRYVTDSHDFELKYVHFRALSRYSQSDIKEKFGPQFEPSLEKVLDDPDLDAVWIATPIDSHYALVKRALTSGKHVLSEKPLTLDIDQAQELAGLASEKNLCLMTDYTHAFSAALHHAAGLVHKGCIGEIQCIEVDWLQQGRFTGYDVYALIGSHALSVIDLFVPLQELTFEPMAQRRLENLVTQADIHIKDVSGSISGKIVLSLHHEEKHRCLRLAGSKGVLIYEPLKHPVLKLGWEDEQTQAFIAEQTYDFDESHNIALALECFYKTLESKGKGNLDTSVRITELISQWGKIEPDEK